jgi:putative RecB family exonuclease
MSEQAPGGSDPGGPAETPALAAEAVTVTAALPPAAVPAVAAGGPGGQDNGGAPVTVHRSLSPSRAADFLTCPLLYRFRVIDRLPEPPSPAAARGTLVHAVLERLFDAPPRERTPAAARSLIQPQWERLSAEEPELATLFADDAERAVWLDEAGVMLDRYFTLEDPTRLEPAHREMSVQTMLETGLTLRGYIDRLDVAPTGEVRVVDYKTGTAPREEYEARALFQMKFYALVLWRASGTIPRQLQLIYLGNGEIMRWAPDESDLLATERKINALWQAIERARSAGDWRPRKSRLCDWCAHQALCPVFGGTPPPLPAEPAPASHRAAGPESASPESASPESASPESASPESGSPQPASPAAGSTEPAAAVPASRESAEPQSERASTEPAVTAS